MTETEVCRWYDLILNSMLLSRSKRANVGYEFTGQCVPAPLKPETARRMSVEQFERCCEYAIATSNHVSWLQTNALSFANHVHHVHILRMSYLIIHVYNIYIYILYGSLYFPYFSGRHFLGTCFRPCRPFSGTCCLKDALTQILKHTKTTLPKLGR